MKKIINLMKLDFITLQGKSLYILLGILFVMCLFSFVFLPHLAVGITAFVGFTLQPVFTVGEKCGYNKLYGVLPVKKNHIAIARFLLGFIFIAAVTLISVTVGYISANVSFAKQFDFSKEIWLLYEMLVDADITILVFGANMFMVGCLFAGIEYLILFAFGTSKEISVTFVCGMIFCVVAFAINQIFDLNTNNIVNWLAPILMYHQTGLILSCCSIGILFMAVCCIISIIALNKKEL